MTSPDPAPTASPSPPPPPPAWRPPVQPPERRRYGSVVFGIIILAIGLWFFATRTLGLDLPRIDWAQLWPIILIGVGLWVVVGAVRRDRR